MARTSEIVTDARQAASSLREHLQCMWPCRYPLYDGGASQGSTSRSVWGDIGRAQSMFSRLASNVDRLAESAEDWRCERDRYSRAMSLALDALHRAAQGESVDFAKAYDALLRQSLGCR